MADAALAWAKSLNLGDAAGIRVSRQGNQDEESHPQLPDGGSSQTFKLRHGSCGAHGDTRRERERSTALTRAALRIGGVSIVAASRLTSPLAVRMRSRLQEAGACS